ncbi:PEP-CTERM sorting domain-containing protein [Luteolibacter sp. SL250]|uniref:VIT domain-containing protein n=1 Tax=Luteolibacter sp. SL250 TaxID=2995170 RepID=UPI00226F8B31|nr:VIT domain-containing protein [Luteolibacter sp. SL250]WAC20396.1 PEP-CTERM sorting domain-containing protein [Luteolibacter sp. SL250]
MKQWTPQAEQRLSEYLVERARREHLEGEDAAELKDDLRRHVFEEAEKESAEMIGLMHLETILGAMDAGYRPAPETVSRPAEKPQGSFFVWAFGVVAPLLILLLEVFTALCGSVLFDPIPTVWHILLVASVPALNAWLLKGAPKAKDVKWKGVAAGVAMMASGFYALLFIPVIHWSLLGLLWFGFGMIPLTPVLAGFASWRISRRVKDSSPVLARFRSGWRIGAAFTLAVICLLEVPAAWTRVNLNSAASAAGNEAAVARLRAFHSERTLLKACYEVGRSSDLATDIVGWMSVCVRSGGFLFGNAMTPGNDPGKTRGIYFRVTGRPFNSVKPPERGGRALLGLQDPMAQFEFDEHLGGDEVAVRLKHLDLKESRFDGHIDSVSEIGYGEWTMVFHNGARNAQEARCQIRLPEGGRVSRLTLWVNGEPREAAFSTVSKVKAAYKEIAVVQRRDPVLVTMVGPDTVLVQCFPVPARGDMKIRLGITAPLQDGAWDLPRIVERNFGTVPKLEHAVWLQGDRDFRLSGGKGLASQRDGEGRSLSAALPVSAAMADGPVVRLDAYEPVPLVWCEDRFAASGERFLIREPRLMKTDPSGKVVLVIDGSQPMAPFKEMIIRAMGGSIVAILADDSAKRITAEDLRKYTFSGGRDNEAALLDAIRVSREEGGAPIVWIHGPQAVGVSNSERLSQMLERGSVRPVIHTIEAVPGPNRLAEAMYRSARQIRGPRLTDGESLKGYLTGLLEGTESTGWTWRRSATADGLVSGEVWDQLARSWAIGAAEGAPGIQVPEEQRSALAARYQLVTPVSGAVVLETDDQYARHGLTPTGTDAAPQMPTVPEPSSALLFLLTTGLALFVRRR